MIQQFSFDTKVNQFYQQVAQMLVNPHEHHFSTFSSISAIVDRFNERFDTIYRVLDHGMHEWDLTILSDESLEMDQIFVRVIKQSLPLGVLVKVYKEV